MPRACWAASRGNCSTKMSGEHVLTEGLFFDRMLSVQGFKRPLPPKVSRDSLKAKVLCKTHNSDLAPLDDEAIRLTNALREHIRATSPTQSQVSIDGWKMERWCTKTGIGLLASKWLGDRPFFPDAGMVNVAFGEHRLPDDCGLYVVKKPAITLHNDADQFRWIHLTDAENEVLTHGFIFQLFGFGLLIATTRGDPTAALRTMPDRKDGLDWTTAEVSHRPLSMDSVFSRTSWQADREARLTIKFVW